MPEARDRFTEQSLEPLIFTMRGRRVILDADLARIYGVSTKALNQAVKRNATRFPLDFAFQLNAGDLASLKSQFVTSRGNRDANQGDELMWSQSVTTSQKYRRADLNPWVFAEHGALMAANVLLSRHAVQMSYLCHPGVCAVAGACGR